MIGLRSSAYFARVAILSVSILSFSSLALADPVAVELPPQPLGAALRELARQTGIQVAIPAELIDGKMSVAIKGKFEPADALNKLLKGSGLIAYPVNKNTYGIRSDSSAGKSDGSTTEPTVDVRSVVQLEEIVVTAQKRPERLQDVPMSLTALNGERLAQSKSYRLEDFVGKVPGLTLIQDGALGSQLVIRGMTTGVQSINSSVATYVDETPYTVEGPFAGSFTASPNLDTFDMQRIEVLRGPQGTLYGANALGGLLKYVTNRPDPSGFAATAETGVSSVHNGGIGFDVHSMINMPLADDTAVRLVGYDTYYPGFIDDPSRGLKDINGSRILGGRASFLYKPIDSLSIRLSAIYQDRSWNDYGDEDVNSQTLRPIYGELIKENLVGQPGHAVTQVYNATLDWDAGFADLLSTTSYYSLKPRANFNYSVLDGAVSSILGQPVGVAIQYRGPVQALTQEVRLTSPTSQSLQWQVGGYFTNESANEYEGFFPADIATKKIVFDFPTNLGAFYIPVHYREYAAFANIDYHFTPTLDVSVGGRYSENDQKFQETAVGILGGPGGADFTQTSSQGVFTYSGDVRWHITPEHMLYARIASGFVPGGPNDIVPGSSLPNSYSSSTTINYEAGIKSSFLSGRVTTELSVFDIHWHDIQLVAQINGLGTIANGGTAQSDGVEFNLTYLPIDGLTLNVNGAYTDARLTQATPASVGGQVGDRLPSVPLWEMSASAQYERPISGNLSGFAGAEWRFMGNRYSEFSVGPRVNMPAFHIVDLRTGVETKKWSLSLYVKNVGDKIAINYVQPELLADLSPAQAATVYTPRTIGLDITARF